MIADAKLDRPWFSFRRVARRAAGPDAATHAGTLPRVEEDGLSVMSNLNPAAPKPEGEGRPRPMTPAELRHHENRFLKALELLIHSGKARTIDDLIRYAEQDHQAEAAGHLRAMAAEGLPVDLAFDSLRVHTRIVAHKRNSKLLQECQGLKVGIVLPLPPHVIDAFGSMADVTLLVPDGHHLPPHLRGAANCRQGSRASRDAAGQLDVIVFEACTAKDGYAVDAGAADIVDPRILRQNTRLIVHVRPHRNPNDVRLAADAGALHVL
jgi:hypothetical protein